MSSLKTGCIVHIDPDTGEVHQMKNGSKDPTSLVGKVSNVEGRDLVRIGPQFYSFFSDSRIQNDMIAPGTKKGWFLIIEI
jgi:hypothetical protein